VLECALCPCCNEVNLQAFSGLGDAVQVYKKVQGRAINLEKQFKGEFASRHALRICELLEAVEVVVQGTFDGTKLFHVCFSCSQSSVRQGFPRGPQLTGSKSGRSIDDLGFQSTRCSPLLYSAMLSKCLTHSKLGNTSLLIVCPCKHHSVSRWVFGRAGMRQTFRRYHLI
jgi:hypothetical protein